MGATDGDDAVVNLLSMNTQRNAPSCQARKLFWGTHEPLRLLGLKRKPDFVLAAGVMYSPEAWGALLHTIKMLSGSSTLVLIGDQRRPEHDATPFYKALADEFDIRLLP